MPALDGWGGKQRNGAAVGGFEKGEEQEGQDQAQGFVLDQALFPVWGLVEGNLFVQGGASSRDVPGWGTPFLAHTSSSQ